MRKCLAANQILQSRYLQKNHKTCLEHDSTLQLSPDDFPKDDDSTVLLRDRTRNTKLENHFKLKGIITQETAHTLTLDTIRGRQVVSKRDVAKVKTKSASTSPKNTHKGNDHSLGKNLQPLKTQKPEVKWNSLSH